MRLDHFDLNLLIAFDALMRERSVTQAARRLNLTQSAMSAALKRLREALEDDVLVQHGKRMIPTAKAQALSPQVAEAVEGLRSLLTSTGAFDPARSTRRFRVIASDYITIVLLAPLIARLEKEAPGITLDLGLPQQSTTREIESGNIDLSIAAEPFLTPGHPAELLFSERHVVVGCASNPVLQGSLSTDDFYACSHVSVHIYGRPAFIEAWMQASGDQRRVEIIAPSFVEAPWLVRNTRRLALMHERLARQLAGPLSLAVAECPFPLPVMNEMMQFHFTRATDPGLLWLRRELRDMAESSVCAIATQASLR